MYATTWDDFFKLSLIWNGILLINAFMMSKENTTRIPSSNSFQMMEYLLTILFEPMGSKRKNPNGSSLDNLKINTTFQKRLAD